MTLASRLTPTDHAIRRMRDPAPFAGIATARFVGLPNADTAFSATRWPNNRIDIFAAAIAAGNHGKHPDNNWLSKDQKPINVVYPDAVGVYVSGTFGIDRIVELLIEHGMLVFEQDNTTLLRQPLLTLPSGAAFARSVAATAEVPALADGSAAAVEARRIETVSFGPNVPMGLFEFRENVVFEKEKQLSAFLELRPEVLAHIRAIVDEQCPAYGAGISVIVHGTQELPVGANA